MYCKHFIFINFYYSRLILKELNELNKIGDIALVTDIRSSGVRLFYALMSEYVVFKTCPPIDKFVLAILQTIGNVRNT
jgi:hypothetical protein